MLTAGEPGVSEPAETALTPDEERFVEEYLIDFNGTAAYLRVHPGVKRWSAKVMASRLLTKVNLQEAIKLGAEDLTAQANVTAVEVVTGLAKLAFYDFGAAYDLSTDDWRPLPPRKIPRDVRLAIQGVKIVKRHDDEGNVVETVEYKFADKNAAFDKLMRYLSLYRDLPALEVLLGALPPDVAATVRTALAASVHEGGGAAGGARGDEPDAGAPADGPDAPDAGGGPDA